MNEIQKRIRERKKELRVEIEWKHLEAIANYYEFPVAIFLSSKIPKTQRKYKVFSDMRRIQKIIDKYLK